MLERAEGYLGIVILPKAARKYLPKFGSDRTSSVLMLPSILISMLCYARLAIAYFNGNSDLNLIKSINIFVAAVATV